MTGPRLGPNDRIVTAYAEACAGPGWANTLVWVVIRDGDGRLRHEALQPDEQNGTMKTLFGISEQVHQQMTAAANLVMKPARSAKRAA